MQTIPNPATGGKGESYVTQFGRDDQDWYIMKVAFENGDDPRQVLRSVRHRFKVVEPERSPVQTSVPTGWPSASDEQPVVPWPPGRAGVIARFIFDRSYSPVREVAIAATLALLAGVCGRAYRTYTGKDIALYLILVARSGIGKDSTHDGIPLMIKLASTPMAEGFVRAQDFVSGEALHKELLRGPGFLALQGEFGRKLKRMSNPMDTPMQNLRTVMTNAYGKQFLEGKSYSRAEDSLMGVDWPALSFLGETTPSTFLECLTPDMMADGFLSRFLTITYEGNRPPPNRARTAQLDPTELQIWQDMVRGLIKYQDAINVPEPCPVNPNDDARFKLETFEEDCRQSLNATEDESERQVWSRAHIKALKVASLLAVADNWTVPEVRIQHVAYALNLVRADIDLFKSRKSSGDVGIGDDARERKLVTILKEYLVTPVPTGYKVPDAMRQNSLVPRNYLLIRTKRVAAFYNHKLDGVRALDDTIASMIASGYLMEVHKDKVAEAYSHHGRSFRIIRLPE